jgi:hypothetical protein
VDSADEPHDEERRRLAGEAGTPRFARSFFLRCRSFFQRLIGLDPRPIGGILPAVSA